MMLMPPLSLEKQMEEGTCHLPGGAHVAGHCSLLQLLEGGCGWTLDSEFGKGDDLCSCNQLGRTGEELFPPSSCGPHPGQLTCSHPC